jgi:pimeloyl-ACP methyl ester carboxylesterase
MRSILKTYLVGLAILAQFSALIVQASDLAKEQRWADQIIDSIMVGEARWLSAKGQKFLGIYSEITTKKSFGGIIILHGIGIHPNWTDIVHPLRTRLPDHGWHTLSLQMPILANEAEYDDYAPLFAEIAPRINAGVAFLHQKGINNIIIIGHSLGSTMASYFIANNPNVGIKALVAVGVSGDLFNDNQLGYFATLAKLKLPILDIFGSHDLLAVLDTEQDKAEIAREAGNLNYLQLKVPNANHFFEGKEDQLIENIVKWLMKLPSPN